MTPEKKLQKIIHAQKDVLVKRDSEIDGVWLTILAGEHGFFFGPPGVAKSLIVADVARYFPGTEYFYHLMGKHTVPSELFGPVSITSLRNDKFEFKTENYLPEATFAFLDEGFKANGAILNSLLMIMNERLFSNGGETKSVPLQSMFIASNEIPQEAELAAMYDRILFRFNVQDLNRSDDFLHLLKNEAAITDFLKGNPVAQLTSEEFTALRDKVRAVSIPQEVLKGVVEIRDTLAMEHQINASSRRWLRTLKGIRAHATMKGRDEATFSDLTPLIYMLWDNPDQIPVLKKVVWNVANPSLYILQTFRDDITALLNQMKDALDKSQASEHDTVLVEYSTKLDELSGRVALGLSDLIPSDRTKFEDKFKYMLKVLKGQKVLLLTKVGGVAPNAAALGSILEWKPETI